MDIKLQALIEPMLCLSTSHITRETSDLLVGNTSQLPVHYPNEYGAFMECNKERIKGPADLTIVLEFAVKNGIAWIKFDRDGFIIEDLPTYDETWS